MRKHEHNLVMIPLVDFQPGQRLYVCYPYNGKQLHLLASFVSTTPSKTTVNIIEALAPHEHIDISKLKKKPLRANVQACYVYGTLSSPEFSRAYYFKDSRSMPS